MRILQNLLLFVILLFGPSHRLCTEENAYQPPHQEQLNETSSESMEEAGAISPNFKALFFKSMFLVGGLLIAATCGLYLLKRAQARFFNMKGEAEILIVERHTLTPKTQVFLLSVKGKDMMVVESAHQISIQPVPTPIEKEISNI